MEIYHGKYFPDISKIFLYIAITGGFGCKQAVVFCLDCCYSEITDNPPVLISMNSNDDLIKKTNIQKIAEAGARIYESIKLRYEPVQNGKFLAIDVDSKKTYIGNTSSEAVELARKAHPNKVFYVVKIGFSAAETLAALGFSSV